MRAALTRISRGPDGETHFDEVDEPLELAEFAPPAPLMDVSAARVASSVRFIGAPAGWDSPLHDTPRRQYVVILAGLCEVIRQRR